jgi:superfamily II DNA or RNA helicase
VSVELRPYQLEAIQSLFAAWSGTHPASLGKKMRRPAVVMATGLGKTVTFAELIRQCHAAGRRALVLVHRDELAGQAYEKLRAAMPDARLGIVKAKQDDIGADVIIGSVPTLAREARRRRLAPPFTEWADRADTVGLTYPVGLIVADECHHASSTSWRTILEHFGCFDDRAGAAVAAGFTATMYRSDRKGLGDVWEHIVCEKDIRFGVDNGYLVKPRGKRVQVADLELEQVRQSRGDFAADDIGDALTNADAGNAIAEAYKKYAADRPGMIFAPTVATTYHFMEDMHAVGISCEAITGDMSREERQQKYARAWSGETQVLANCMVLTEGFDMPPLSTAVIARPTKSAGLYIQMVGRVLRPFPGKTDALILDVVGASTNHTLASLADLEYSPDPRELYDGEEWDEEAEYEDESLDRESVDVIPLEDKWVATGNLVVSDIDLFAGSPSVWLQTVGGVNFIPAGKAFYFLWWNHGEWQIGRQPDNPLGRPEMVGSSVEISEAMEMAEKWAAHEDARTSSRTAGWRRAGRPTMAQVQKLASLGLPTTGLDKTQAADLISSTLAGRLIDRYLVH